MRISEVSEQYIPANTLRYYERIGLLPPVQRNDGGIRYSSDLDVRWIEFIKSMRSAGLPIEMLIEVYALFRQGDHTIEARKEILIGQRAELTAKMDERQKTLDLLNYKISMCITALVEKCKN